MEMVQQVATAMGKVPKWTGAGMKIVTVCQQANCRSVGMGIVLKDTHKADCIAVGYNANSPEVRGMLFGWADAIILMEGHMLAHVPQTMWGKTLICDVGPDVFWHARNDELIRQCRQFVDAWRAVSGAQANPAG